MKKTLTLLLLLALLLCLCSCRRVQAPEPEPVQPFSFYYRLQTPDYSAPYGPIGMEIRDLGTQTLTDEALLRLYLQGPEDGTLVSPFPPNVQLLSVTASATLYKVQLSSEYALLQGVDASIADACLTETLLGLPNVRRVRITTLDESGNELRSVTLDANDILLSDNQTAADKRDLTLYFADADGRYLLAEKRTVDYRPAGELPQYVTELLLRGPQSAGLTPTLPVGTMLLDINVENGVCAVDLSAEFVENQAALGLAPHLTLLSVANTLTELDGIEQVQFYVEGRQDLSLGAFALDQSFNAEIRAVGPTHPELNELDCVLRLPLNDAQLYSLPLRVRSGSNESTAETLMRLLVDYAPQNGLGNPWYGQPLPRSILLSDGVCTLDFAPEDLPAQDAAGQLALRVLYETLLAQEEIRQVVITADGKAI